MYSCWTTGAQDERGRWGLALTLCIRIAMIRARAARIMTIPSYDASRFRHLLELPIHHLINPNLRLHQIAI